MLLDRKGFDDVENLDELIQATLLHKLVESDAAQLFIYNQLLQLRSAFAIRMYRAPQADCA